LAFQGVFVICLVGEKIKKLRKEKGLTLQDLATSVGLGKSYIWEIENGRIKNPSFEKILIIAKALDVDVEYLVNDQELKVGQDFNKNVLFRKMAELSQYDQDKIIKIIDAWTKN